MKTHFTSLLSSLALSCIVATAASCSDHQKDPVPAVKAVEVNPAPTAKVVPERTLPPTTLNPSPVVAAGADVPESPDVFAGMAAVLDRTNREQSAALTPAADDLSRDLDSGLASWKAKGGTTSSMGDNKLELARTDFVQKIRTLSLADEETWKNAKSAAQDSLSNLRQTYAEVMAGPKN